MTKIRQASFTHSAALLSAALLASAACSESAEPGASGATTAGTSSGGSSSGSSAGPGAGTTSAGTTASIPASGSGGMVSAASGGGAGGAPGGMGGGGTGAGVAGKAGMAGMGGTPVDPNAGTIACALTEAIGAGEGGAGGAAEDGAGGNGAAGEPAIAPGPDTIGGFTLYNWVTDQKFPGCGPFFDDITITVTGTPPVTAVATLDSDIIQALNPNGGAVEGSVLWDYDEVVNGNSNCASVTSTCFNIEGREPFSLFGDETEGNFDGPLTKGNAPALHSGSKHLLRVRAYTGPLGGGSQLGEVAITITVKR